MQTQTPLIDRLIKAIEESKTEFTCCKESDTEFEVFGSKHTTDELIKLVNMNLGCKGTYMTMFNGNVWVLGDCSVAMLNSDWTFEIIVTE